MSARSWEAGSEFHWLDPPRVERRLYAPWTAGTLVSTGRDALRLVLEQGARERGWRRLWVPEYFCQHVVAALARCHLELLLYPDDPVRPVPDPPPARRGDVVLLMNYFGLRAPLSLPWAEGVEVLEDHAHDPEGPWAIHSRADFCIASLRKTLPLPDGGVIWSPRGHRLPAAPPPTEAREAAVAAKLQAMLLKALHLAGHPVARESYRALQLEGEELLADPEPSGPSVVTRALLDLYPTERWRSARAANHATLRDRLSGCSWARALEAAPAAGVPFACAVLLASPALRDRVRLGLIAANVFPAAHWPLERTLVPVSARAVEVSRRMLVLHCDARYGTEDMQRVGDIFVRAGERARAAAGVSGAVLDEGGPVGGEEVLLESR